MPDLLPRLPCKQQMLNPPPCDLHRHELDSFPDKRQFRWLPLSRDPPLLKLVADKTVDELVLFERRDLLVLSALDERDSAARFLVEWLVLVWCQLW